MEILSYEKAADLLALLYKSEFNGKNNGRFRIARTELAKLSGRKYIKQPSVDGISVWLAEKHELLLIDLKDEFPVIKESIVRRYRKANSNVLREVLDISDEPESADDED